MTDLTILFKATIKAAKLKDKNLTSGPDKSIISKPKKSEFAINAKNVAVLISKLQEFLLENRKEYVNDAGYLGLGRSKLTDLERNQIESQAELFMKKCQEAIKQLKIQAHSQKVGSQFREHKDLVLNTLEKYLIAVCQLYTEQKAIRVKRAIDKKRLSKLQLESIIFDNNGYTSQNIDNTVSNMEPDLKLLYNEKSSNDLKKDSENLKNGSIDDESSPLTHSDSSLSPEEEQMLQIENDHLYEEMSSMIDEIKQIEGKIIEISRLQEVFTSKVLQQEQDIDKVSEVVVGTTENIKDANDEIREAMKNNAGFRVWILFFLIVCTFSLLFLDWYNP